MSDKNCCFLCGCEDELVTKTKKKQEMILCGLCQATSEISYTIKCLKCGHYYFKDMNSKNKAEIERFIGRKIDDRAAIVAASDCHKCAPRKKKEKRECCHLCDETENMTAIQCDNKQILLCGLCVQQSAVSYTIKCTGCGEYWFIPKTAATKKHLESWLNLELPDDKVVMLDTGKCYRCSGEEDANV